MLCPEKGLRHKRPHIVSFHLYETSKRGKSIHTESRIVIFRGYWQGGWGCRYGIPFCSEEHILEFWIGDGCTHYEYTEKHLIVHFKRVNFMVCEYYLIHF